MDSLDQSKLQNVPLAVLQSRPFLLVRLGILPFLANCQNEDARPVSYRLGNFLTVLHYSVLSALCDSPKDTVLKSSMGACEDLLECNNLPVLSALLFIIYFGWRVYLNDNPYLTNHEYLLLFRGTWSGLEDRYQSEIRKLHSPWFRSSSSVLLAE